MGRFGISAGVPLDLKRFIVGVVGIVGARYWVLSVVCWVVGCCGLSTVLRVLGVVAVSSLLCDVRDKRECTARSESLRFGLLVFFWGCWVLCSVLSVGCWVWCVILDALCSLCCVLGLSVACWALSAACLVLCAVCCVLNGCCVLLAECWVLYVG